MQKRITLDEQAMLAAEAHIPELATQALQRAYVRALSTSGMVLEAINGQLVESYANGQHRVVRSLPAPVPVAMGTIKRRNRVY